ncbi:protein YebE [Thalassobaculum fulvum]|uniref:Protein YebE n=1 Tax=Thalassobaculum fulvum TaxID=1633335 RepID=A0A919CN04_9PROT|nr:tellurite resistance TerB family protein [Thalassobaculum fulvum]GHD42382.1 protein YebE [Thalassobaculum fulvum]
MDPTKLLDQFLGGDAKAAMGRATDAARRQADAMGGLGGLAGGAAAGGLIALLLGSKKVRKMAGGAAAYGGAAALGALAYRAYTNWQAGRSAADAPVATAEDVARAEPRFLPEAAPAADGQPFQLALIRAMVGAAKADGHVDADEQARLFESVDRMGLDAAAKGFVFDLLAKPVDLGAIASAAQSPEQAAELYLVSRLAIDPDHPAERAYLEALAHRLSLPADLVAHLDRQAESGLPT